MSELNVYCRGIHITITPTPTPHKNTHHTSNLISELSFETFMHKIQYSAPECTSHGEPSEVTIEKEDETAHKEGI
jgi:hypothetical protein